VTSALHIKQLSFVLAFQVVPREGRRRNGAKFTRAVNFFHLEVMADIKSSLFSEAVIINLRFQLTTVWLRLIKKLLGLLFQQCEC
jgi:hypothetical protein